MPLRFKTCWIVKNSLSQSTLKTQNRQRQMGTKMMSSEWNETAFFNRDGERERERERVLIDKLGRISRSWGKFSSSF